MEIKTTIVYEGKKYKLEYSDLDDFSILPLELCRQIYGVCFVDGKIIVAKNGKKNTWGLPGGTIEKGETIDQAFRREIIEETNSEILKSLPIGYQRTVDSDGKYIYQLRSCCLVKRLGEFTSDPAGSVTEIKLINPNDHKKYFDWGNIGERIIKRAIELKTRLE